MYEGAGAGVGAVIKTVLEESLPVRAGKHEVGVADDDAEAGRVQSVREHRRRHKHEARARARTHTRTHAPCGAGDGDVEAALVGKKSEAVVVLRLQSS